MAGFTKLFSEIVTSSIWCEDDKIRIVWITMLALAGPTGMVKAAVPGLANAARVSVEDCQKALLKFQEPDEFSRSSDFGGRRIKKVEGGFLILNYTRYRETLSKEERRIYKTDKQRQYRKAGTSAESAYVKAEASGDRKAADDIAATRMREESTTNGAYSQPAPAPQDL